MNLLLLSSSRVASTSYLAHALPLISEFLNLTKRTTPIRILFIPFAGVTISFDEYETMVKNALSPLDVEITSIHHSLSKSNSRDIYKEQIQNADCILVGGGNTFSLLEQLYKLDLIKIIHDEVKAGKPYIGWSAGSNIAGATIRTTNDMPIVEPPSFNALKLVPWQLNPHYIEATPSGHNGETRQQRLEEFLVANPQGKVIAIPEGTALICKNKSIIFNEGQQKGALAYLFSSKGKIPVSTNINISDSIEKFPNN